MLQFIKHTTVIPFMKIKGLVEILCLALVVGSIVLDVLSKKNEKFPLISRVVALIAVVFGFLSAFCI